MDPTIGRIVHFRLTAKQAEEIVRRRVAKTHDAGWPAGAQAHVGNSVAAGRVVPLVVTAVWPEEYATGAYLEENGPEAKYESSVGVNGQALLDGNDSLWVCSAPQHSELNGCWFWPPRAV